MLSPRNLRARRTATAPFAASNTSVAAAAQYSGTKHVGRADTARTYVAHVAGTGKPREDKAEWNRTEQIAARKTDAACLPVHRTENHDIAALPFADRIAAKRS
jgi:hypothetical protein